MPCRRSQHADVGRGPAGARRVRGMSCTVERRREPLLRVPLVSRLEQGAPSPAVVFARRFQVARRGSGDVMKAIVVKPGQKDTIHMRDMPDPKIRADEVAVRVIRVGLCGTDAEINHGVYGKPPDGEELLILGHENLGVVEDVGKNVRGWKRGDLVVSTVRRPCGICPQCNAGQNDMCSSGRYTERGIMRRHGFMAEYYVESPVYLNRIPKDLGAFAVLPGPMPVAEKGIDYAYL